MSQKVFIKTFGCQMNVYDSDKMADVLSQDQGLSKTEVLEEADVILFNTCSVREKAQEKLFSDLGRIRSLKQKKPNLLIGVGGCVASQEGEAILKRAPFVDMVFGPPTLHRLPALIRQKQKTGQPQVDVSFPEVEKFDHLPLAKAEGASALVSIMEGCSKYCSFCVVPYTRGEEISRPFEDVLIEIATLAQEGVKEITLLGQNVNAYRSTRLDGTPADFAMLLEYVHAIPGIRRLRYTTSHPREVTPRLIECYRALPNLVSHLHLPVQSGSDRILMAMKRGYTALEYKFCVKKLRQARPQLALSSDFIVGFPGETADDFDQTLQLIDEVQFETAFSFLYSARPGTPAAALHDTTPLSVKKERLHQLQARIHALSDAAASAMLGKVFRVLVERPAKHPPTALVGRTENNRCVTFSGPHSLVGQFITVKITHAHAHHLGAERV